MECPACGGANVADAVFCDQCGARLPAACATCGARNRGGARFCRSCGVALAAPVTGDPVAAEAVAPAPESYTPRHLAERILASRAALEGERKQVTVLFADITGSLALLEGRDPDEARAIIDPALTAMMEAVHRYEGTVNQVMGDGIMALFGAPLAHEDHALRACCAALTIQDLMRRYAETTGRARGVDVRVRIGLNSGEVVVRAIGSDLKMDYSAVGETTHLAARMEQSATPGTIRLTAATQRLCGDLVDVRALGPQALKGVADPVAVFELMGVRARLTRLRARAARGLSRFVGRDAELALLSEIADRVSAGHGQAVGLVAEAGVGKSRLLWELLGWQRTAGWLVLEGAAVSYGKAISYLPVVEALKGYFAIDERDDADAIRAKVKGRLSGLDAGLVADAPALLALLEIGGDATWQALEPAARRQRTLDAIKRLLMRESQDRPVLLLLEDLQWVDAATLALADTLLDGLSGARVLMVLSYRPEFQPRWGHRSHFRQLRIEPLAPSTAEMLLADLLGEDPALAELEAQLIAQTEGNPLFIEESVRTLVETGVLAGTRGAYRVARAPAGIKVPPTVQAVLAARVDRLAPDDKRLLQAAAAVGRDVPLRVLERVADVTEPALRRSLAALQASEFLHERTLFPDVEYGFVHALVQEIAYAGLTHERRRELHGRILDAVEALAGDRRSEHAERLAHHALRGERWEPAVRYLREAGRKAHARAAHGEAAAFLEQALAILPRLGDGPISAGQAIDLRFELRDALFPLGGHTRIAELLAEADALAITHEDRARAGRAALYFVNHFLAVREPARALEAGERALAIADAVGDDELRTTTNFYLVQLHVGRGDYARAVELNRRNVQRLEAREAGPFGRAAMLALSRTWLVWCLAELGAFEEARARGETALRQAEASEQPLELILACLGLGLAHLRRGELAEATGVLERGLTLARAGDLPIGLALASPLAHAYTLAGRGGEAVALLERVVAPTAAARGGGHALRMAHLAEAYLVEGRTAEGWDLAQHALEVARSQGERGHEAYVLRLLGEIAARREPVSVAEAERHYAEAGALAAALELRPLQARCRLGLGMLLARNGESEAASREIAAARAMLADMGMTFWVTQADAPA